MGRPNVVVLHARSVAMLLVLTVLMAGVGLGAAPRAGADGDDDSMNPPLPASGVWFGSGVGMGDQQQPLDEESDLEEHQAFVDRKFAVVREYHAWDEEFPTDFEYWLKSQGQIPVMSWNAGMSDHINFAPWADIAAGRYDGTIDARAAAIKAYKSQVYLAFHHEPEPHGDLPDFGTPAEFVSAWQHIHDRFATDGVTNVTWVLILLNTSYGKGTADDYYPGDSYVNILGADGYNWYGCDGHPGAAWQPFSDVFDGFYDYGLAHDKSMFVTEYGTGEDPLDPNRKAQWFTDELATLEGWPQIKAVLYYDHDENDSCDFWVGSSEAATASFQALGADPYLNPPPPLVWITSGPDALTNSTSARFVFSANERGVTYTCSLDLGLSAPCSSGVTYAGLDQGDHTLRILATDRSGIRGWATYEWSVDSVAPLVDITSGPPDPSYSQQATFTFEASEDGVTFTCQLDLDPPYTCHSPDWENDLSQGLHTFTVYATDGAGNQGLPAAYIWHVSR